MARDSAAPPPVREHREELITLRTSTSERPPLIAVVGPTAVGKSAFAFDLAERVGGEIVSADSRQIYRQMDVGTAKPTPEEQRRVRHHLIDVVDPDGAYTVALFQRDAAAAIAEIHRRGNVPLLVGGTGLYVRAVIEGLTIPPVPPDPALRAELEAIADRAGAATVHQQLAALDPVAASRIHPNNVRRVIRAIEVCQHTGRPISALQRVTRCPYRVLTIGLAVERAELYRRIDDRVEQQIVNGLIEENRRLLVAGYSPDLPSMTGLGYRQIQLYLQGRLALPDAIQLLKYETHRFARQQHTWFRRDDPRIRWFEARSEGLRAAAAAAQAFTADRRVATPT